MLAISSVIFRPVKLLTCAADICLVLSQTAEEDAEKIRNTHDKVPDDLK